MKKIITLTLLFAFSETSFCQKTNNLPTLTKQEYLQKSKNQKTAAWIMLGGGTIVGFVGLTQLNFAGSDNGEVNNTPGAILFFTGLASVITSIPFFSASKKNKKKTRTMTFKMQQAPKWQSTNLVNGVIPSLNLKISL